MSRFIADENFPHPSFKLLVSKGFDVLHVGLDFPSVSDDRVIQIAIEEQRILLTLDRDHGRLIFTRKVPAPPGVVYFRIPQYRPDFLGEVFAELISSGVEFEGFFTVVRPEGIRQRPL